jgi:deoxyribonuclease I
MRKILLSTLLLTACAHGRSYNSRVNTFREAKKALQAIHADRPYTLYCSCRYQGKTVDHSSCGYVPRRPHGRRAKKVEWEHVVPAHAFGQAFPEWRQGAPGCKKKGRKCAQKNPEYAKMEADLYNLWPEVGELNELRSNFSMAELPDRGATFGACTVVIEDRKFEPMDSAKGIVARTYLYMEQAYPGRGIISNKNEKLFEAWDKLYPVTPWECQRAKRIEVVQGNPNPILQAACTHLRGTQSPLR